MVEHLTSGHITIIGVLAAIPVVMGIVIYNLLKEKVK